MLPKLFEETMSNIKPYEELEITKKHVKHSKSNKLHCRPTELRDFSMGFIADKFNGAIIVFEFRVSIVHV